LYRHLNGKWLDTFVIPADKSTYGSFTFIDDQAQQQMRGIVESLTDSTGKVTVTGDAAVDARQIGGSVCQFHG
jgi:predicted metalloendopeptidase